MKIGKAIPAGERLFGLGLLLCLLYLSAAGQINEPQHHLSEYTIVQYHIPRGQHYVKQRKLKWVNTNHLKFVARFDNSAIYRTIDPRNQLDINKLYGFSEGLDHQFNSARFGWRFSNDSVRLFAYVYANGKRSVAEICTVPLNEPIQCSIKVFPTAYLLSAGNNQVQMERGVASPIAKGFLQYPYFGGNETAPHDVYISIGTFSK